MEQSTIALIIIAVMMILYVTELFPLAVTSILACVAFAVFGVIPMGTAFSGFGSDIVYLIIGMVVVGNALFETGVAQFVGKTVMSRVGGNEKVFIIAVVLVSTSISMFLSNTATVAIMLPIMTSAVVASKGRLSKKNTFMMVGIVSVAGGGLTLVGSTPQLIAQGFLKDGGHEYMSFFEIGKIGLPVLLLCLIYFLTIGNKLQKKAFDFPEVADDISMRNMSGRDKDNSPKNVSKMIISVAILMFCIVGFITGLFSTGIVAMIGASLCILTGCISQKRVFEKMDWTTIVIMGASIGISNGVAESGGGVVIAQSVINLIGDNMSPWVLSAVLAFVAMVLTNFMSSSATAALLVPIAGIMALELGYDVKSTVMIIAIAANIGYATPIATPPLTMTLAGGYRFKDYVKVGGLFNLLAYILVILLIPLMLNIYN